MLNNYTVKELRAIAKKRGEKGYSKLRKADLITFLKKSNKRCGPGKVLNPVTNNCVKEKRKVKKIEKSKVKKIEKSKVKKIEKREKFREKEWYIFTIKSCGYCKEAKDLLRKKGKKFGYMTITDKNEDRIYKQIDPYTKKYRYFPVIFHKGKFIGGFSELQKKLK